MGDPGVGIGVVTFPSDEILEVTTEKPGPENLENPVAYVAIFINDRVRRRGWMSSGEFVVMIRFEKRDVECGMDFHADWKVQSEGGSPNGFDYLERTQEFEIEFVAGPLGSDVGALEKDELAFLEIRGAGSTTVGILLLKLLGVGHGGLTHSVGVLEVFDVILSGRSRDVTQGG